MERPIFQPIGSPAEELDTPALVVDLGVMEQNIAVLHDAFRGSEDGSATGQAVVRPHVSCHGCPEIARLQMSAAGNSGGVAVSSLAEAEAFAAVGADIPADAGDETSHGAIDDILIAGRVVTTAKIGPTGRAGRSDHVERGRRQPPQRPGPFRGSAGRRRHVERVGGHGCGIWVWRCGARAGRD